MDYNVSYYTRESRIIIIIILSGLIFYLPMVRTGIVVNDDGLLLSGALRVLNGQIPGREFPRLDGPLSCILIAVFFKVFSPGIFQFKIYWILLRILLAILIYLLGKRVISRHLSLVPSILSMILPGHWYKTYFQLIPIINLILLYRFLDTGSIARLILIGIGIGVSFLIRQDASIFSLFVDIITLFILSFFYTSITRLKKFSISDAISSIVVIISVAICIIGIFIFFFRIPWFEPVRLIFQIIASPETRPAITLPDPFATEIMDLHASFFYVPLLILPLLLIVIFKKLKQRLFVEVFNIFPIFFVSLILLNQILWLSTPGRLLQILPPIFILWVYFYQEFHRFISKAVRSSLVKTIFILFAISLLVTYTFFIFFSSSEPAYGTMGLKRTMTQDVASGCNYFRHYPNRAYEMNESKEFIDNETKFDESIFCFPELSLYYFLCNRHNPLKFDYLGFISAPYDFNEYTTSQCIEDLIKSRTKYILYSEPIVYQGKKRESNFRVSNYLPELYAWIMQNYRPMRLFNEMLVLEKLEKPDETGLFFAKGFEAFKYEEWSYAISNLREYIKSSDPEPWVFFILGESFQKALNPDSASFYLEKSFQQGLQDPMLLEKGFNITSDLEKFLVAINIFNKIPEKYISKKTMVKYGRALVKSGKLEKGIEVLSDLLTRNYQNDFPEIYLYLGDAWKFLHEDKRAEEMYVLYQEKVGETDRNLERMGKLKTKLEDWDQAFFIYKKLYEKNPQKIEYVINLGFLLRKKGKPEQSLELLENIKTSNQEYRRQIYIEKGKANLIMKNYLQGIQNLKAAYKLEPEDLECGLLIASSLKDTGNFKNALGFLDTLNQKYPKSTEAILLKGRIFHESGDYQKALNQFLIARSLDRNNPQILRELGNEFYLINNKDMAFKIYKELLDNYPDDFIALYRQGMILYEMGNKHKALKLFEKAEEYASDPVNILKMKTQINFEIGNNEVAYRLAKKLCFFKPDDGENWYLFGKISQRLKKYKDTATAFSKVYSMNIFQNKDIFLLYGQALYNCGNYLEALKVVSDGLKNNPENLDLWMIKAQSELKNGNYEDALYSFRRIYSEKKSFEVLTGLGDAYSTLDNPLKAKYYYELAGKACPYEFEKQWLIGKKLEKFESYELASESFEKASGTVPEDSLFILDFHKAKMDEKLGRLKKALEILNELSVKKPNSSMVIYEIANVYCIMKRWDQFDEFMKNNKKSLISRAEYWNRLGKNLLEAGEIERAVKHFEEGIKYFPDDQEMALNSTKCFHRAGNMRFEEKALRLVLDIDKNHIESLLRLGEIYIQLHDWKKAVESFENVIRIKGLKLEDPMPEDEFLYTYISALYESGDKVKGINLMERYTGKFPMIILKLARIYRDSDKFEKSIEKYKQAINNKELCKSATFELAELYLILKNYKKAASILNSYLRDNNKDRDARLQLCKIYMESKNYGKALDQCNIILFNNQDEMDFLLLSAWNRFYLGQYSHALAEVETVLSRSSGKSDVWLLKGEILIKMNKIPMAIEILKKASAKFPENKSIKEKLNSIESNFTKSR